MDYSPGKETILLVEDEELLRLVIAESLGDLGYRVLTAPGGREALAMSQKFSEEIDVLITDVLMPSLHGIELAEELCRQRPRLKVLFITGDSNEVCPTSPNIGRLNKPFTIKTLVAKVHDLVGT